MEQHVCKQQIGPALRNDLSTDLKLYHEIFFHTRWCLRLGFILKNGKWPSIFLPRPVYMHIL